MRIVRTVLAATFLTTGAVSLNGQTADDQRVVPGSGMAGFGASLLIDGNTIVVGRTGLSAMFPEPPSQWGGLHVFGEENGVWDELYSIGLEGSDMGEDFGRSMAMMGDALLVGAPLADSAAGKIYIFQKNADGRFGSVSIFRLPDAQPHDSTGNRLAVSGDVVLIGVPGRREVHAYRRDNGSWHAAGILAPSQDSVGRFPRSIVFDGTVAMVGEPTRSGGMVTVFSAGDDGWSENAVIMSPDSVSNFGTAIALSGNEVVIGASGRAGRRAGAAYQYRRTGSGWELTQSLTPPDTTVHETIGWNRGAGFGQSVALDGNELWIGTAAAGDNRSGGVNVYRRADASAAWQHAAELWQEDMQRYSAMNGAVLLQGNLGVRTSPMSDFGSGRVLVYSRAAGSEWELTAELIDRSQDLTAMTGEMTRCTEGMAGDFPCDNVEMLSFLPVTEVGGHQGDIVNDLWGWTDPESGREYAIVGHTFGTSFVDVTNPSNPVFLGSLPAHEGSTPNGWRDVKTYDHYALVVADNVGQHGMQIFDLHQLREVRNPPATFSETAHYDGIASSHNVIVSEESHLAVAVGSSDGGETCGGALHMIDMTDPLNPTFAGCFNDPNTGNGGGGSHDAQCVKYSGPDPDYQGHDICLGSNGTALSVADVTDRENPVAVAAVGYPNVVYAHQGWLTDDQRYFYMNDEGDEISGAVTGTRTIVWDLEDLDDPVVATMYTGETLASDHNLYVHGDYMYQSNYVAGLRVIDISNRENPVEVGYFDTVPWGEDVPGFAGSWSNYPFFESGTIVVSSIKEGLFLLKKREELVP
jgi:choice-of-anchor B domain-containing protein